MKCNNCGFENREDAVFCANCGKKIETGKNVSDIPRGSHSGYEDQEQNTYSDGEHQRDSYQYEDRQKESYGYERRQQDQYRYEGRGQQTYQDYNRPPYQPYNNGPYESDMSIGRWFVTILLTFIPIVGLILLIVWAAAGDKYPSRKNWAIAQLIWMIIIYVIVIVVIIVGGLALGSLFY